MRKILFMLALCSSFYLLNGQEYKKWEEHAVKGFYVLAKSEAEAANYSDALEEDGDYYIPTKVKNDTYKIEVGDKISSKLYQIRGTSTYMYFQFVPFLWKFDEGMLEIWGNKGTFYKNPK